jgi:hypothetical protein
MAEKIFLFNHLSARLGNTFMSFELEVGIVSPSSSFSNLNMAGILCSSEIG